MRFLALIALAACAPAAPATAVRAAALTDPAPCARAADLGIVPDTGLDQGGAIQVALNAGCLELAAGTYTIVTPATRSAYAVLALAGELRGAGPDTVLAFTGDAGGRDWRGIVLGAGAWVHDLTVDASALTGVTQQSPVLRLTGPLDGYQVSGVTCLSTSAGDCLQIVGYAPDRLVTHGSIHDNAFTGARSGIAIHSGAQDLVIAHNRLVARDQAIDMEGTGDIARVEIAGNTVELSTVVESGIAFSLYLATDLHVHDNVLHGAGMQLYGVARCEIDHDDITQTVDITGTGVLDILKDSTDVTIHDEQVTRAASAGNGSVVRTSPRGSGIPTRIAILDSTFRSASSALVDINGTAGARVEGTSLAYLGSLTTAIGVHVAASSTVRTTDVVLDHIAVTGVQTAVYATGSYAGMGALTVSNSSAPGATVGLRCDNVAATTKMGGISGPVTYTGNAMPAATCGLIGAP